MTKQQGSVTVVMVALLAVAGMLVTATAQLGAAAVARARAETAADAAALAAADALALGRTAEAAEAAAHHTARDNGAELVRCDCSGRIVDVTASSAVRLPGGIERTTRARSRAEVRPSMSLLHSK